MEEDIRVWPDRLQLTHPQSRDMYLIWMIRRWRCFTPHQKAVRTNEQQKMEGRNLELQRSPIQTRKRQFTTFVRGFLSPQRKYSQELAQGPRILICSATTRYSAVNAGFLVSRAERIDYPLQAGDLSKLLDHDPILPQWYTPHWQPRCGEDHGTWWSIVARLRRQTVHSQDNQEPTW